MKISVQKDLILEARKKLNNARKFSGMYEQVTLFTEISNQLFEDALKNRIIWQGNGKDKRWKFKTEHNKTIAKTSKENIKAAYINYIETYYFSSKKQNMIFAELYAEWLDNRHKLVGIESNNLSPLTYKRYITEYNKFIVDSDLDLSKINAISPYDIESFLLKEVNKHKLTKTRLNNLASIIRLIFRYAKKNNYISENPYLYADLKDARLACIVKKVNDCDRIIDANDMKKLYEVLKKRHASKFYIQDYAIELASLTGMRVGEIAALKWECITEKYILIDFAERRYDSIDGPCSYYIGEPKYKKCRKFPIGDDVKTLLNTIKREQLKHNCINEFVFSNKNGRVNSHTISCAMTRRCNDADIPKKSIHSLRRTVSSKLRTGNFSVAEVSLLLGHTEETNNKHYNYASTPYSELANKLHKVYTDQGYTA